MIFKHYIVYTALFSLVLPFFIVFLHIMYCRYIIWIKASAAFLQFPSSGTTGAGVVGGLIVGPGVCADTGHWTPTSSACVQSLELNPLCGQFTRRDSVAWHFTSSIQMTPVPGTTALLADWSRVVAPPGLFNKITLNQRRFCSCILDAFLTQTYEVHVGSTLITGAQNSFYNKNSM